MGAQGTATLNFGSHFRMALRAAFAALILCLLAWPSEAVQLRDRCRMSTATVGTGTITLGSAISGYQSFAGCGVTDGQIVRYAIDDPGATWPPTAYETGSGTYTSAGTTLSRTVSESSNSDTAISLSGNAHVFITALTVDLPSETTAIEATTNRAADYAFILQGGVLERALLNVISGDVIGPSSATDNAAARFDGTTGKLIQNSQLTIDDTGLVETLNNDAGATSGPILSLYRDSASPAAFDDIGLVRFSGEDSAGNTQTYASIDAEIEDPTGGSEDSGIRFCLQVAGTERCPLNLFVAGPGVVQYLHTDDGAGVGPVFEMFRESSSPAADDYLSEVRFMGRDGAANGQTYGTIDVKIIDPTSTSEDSNFEYWLTKNGALIETMRIEGDHDAYLNKDDGANPGQVVAEHWIKLTSNNTLADSTATQALFDGGGGPTNGRLTVDTGQYFFQCMLHITAMSATSGNGEFEPLGAGTATMSAVLFQVTGMDNNSPLNAGTRTGSGGASGTANAASMVTAGTGTGLLADISGTFDITAAGTIIPSIDLVTGGVTPAVNAGSYCKFNRAGATALATTGAWD